MDYIIAGYRIRIEGEGRDNAFAAALRPFLAPDGDTSEPVLRLETGCRIDPADYGCTELHAFAFDDADADCTFARHVGGYLFTMAPRDGREPVRYVTHDESPLVRSNIGRDVSMYRFGLWMMFGLALNPLHGVAVHSSVIRRGDGAVLFLGESGTGKSTHTRLWRQHILGAELLNDDSPVVRMTDGTPTVYGTPWSGKTPCYRNEHYPIRAIVRLSQAPHNRIRRLPTVMAIGALLPSCPPAFAYDAALQDHVCATLSDILARVPVYHLECLPDEAAARLSFTTVFGTGDDAAGQ